MVLRKRPVALQVVGGVDQASFSTSAFPVGQHSISVTYPGDSTFARSMVASPLVQVVNALATTTALKSSENPSSAGDQVTFTATVAPMSGTGTPSGDVTFSIDGKPETPVALQVVNGVDQASFSISTLFAGPALDQRFLRRRFDVCKKCRLEPACASSQRTGHDARVEIVGRRFNRWRAGDVHGDRGTDVGYWLAQRRRDVFR